MSASLVRPASTTRRPCPLPGNSVTAAVEVDVLWGLGHVERRVGEFGQAREYHTQALSLARQLGYRPGEVLALWGLGEVERRVGEYGQARECHTQALSPPCPTAR